MARRRNDYDSPWKEIIEQFFPAFVAFFLPVAYSEIDWNTPYEFLAAKSCNEQCDDR